MCQHASTCVNMPQHVSTYVSMCQNASRCINVCSRPFTSIYMHVHALKAEQLLRPCCRACYFYSSYYRVTVITDMAHVNLITPLERGQVYRGLAVHADHEVAGIPRLEGGGHNDVAAGGELKPPEHLPVVDVGPRGPGVVVVSEVRRVQSVLGGRGSVQTKSNL